MSEIKLSDDELSLLSSCFSIRPGGETTKGLERIRESHEERLEGMFALFDFKMDTHETHRESVKRVFDESGGDVTRPMKARMLREVRKIEEINRYTDRLYDLYFKLRKMQQ